MASPRYKGNVGIRQIHLETVKNAINGYTTTVKWKGTWSAIYAALDDPFYTDGSANAVATQNGDQAQDGVLTVTFNARSQEDAVSDQPEVDEFSNNWTLVPSTEQIEIHRLPKYQALASLDNGYIERILLAVEDFRKKVSDGIAATDSNKDLTFDLDTLITTQGTTDQKNLAKELAQLVLDGYESDERDRYALRNVRTVPGNTSLTANHAHKNEMWSNDRLVSLINSSAASLTQRSIIGDLQNTFDGTYWLKMAPTIDELNSGRFQIVTTFVNYEENEFREELKPKYE